MYTVGSMWMEECIEKEGVQNDLGFEEVGNTSTKNEQRCTLQVRT